MSRIARARRIVNSTRPPAADWPAWTDDGTWELGPEPADQQWAAENLDESFDSEPPDDHIPTDPADPEPAAAEPDWEAMARESWALHCLEQGVEPFEPAATADAVAREAADAYGHIS
jgi:hypothetical protein